MGDGATPQKGAAPHTVCLEPSWLVYQSGAAVQAAASAKLPPVVLLP